MVAAASPMNSAETRFFRPSVSQATSSSGKQVTLVSPAAMPFQNSRLMSAPPMKSHRRRPGITHTA